MLGWGDIANLAANGLAEGLLIALPAMAVTLVFGVVRFPNAATGDLVSVGGFGAYGAFKLAQGSFALGPGGFAFALCSALVGGLVAGAAAGWAAWQFVFKPVQRSRGVTLLLTSIGLGFVIRALLGLAFGNEHRVFELPPMRAWHVGPLLINPLDALVAALSLGTLAIVFALLHLSPAGRVLRALACNAELAPVVGIDGARAQSALWLVTGAVCGAAGALLGLKSLVSPEAGAELLLAAFAAAVVGGLGNPLGAVVGAVLLGVCQELSTPWVGFTYKIALAYAAMLLVLLWRPQGLFGRREGLR